MSLQNMTVLVLSLMTLSGCGTSAIKPSAWIPEYPDAPDELMLAPVSPEVYVLTRPATLSGVLEQHAREMQNSHELYAQVRGLQAWIKHMHRLYPEH